MRSRRFRPVVCIGTASLIAVCSVVAPAAEPAPPLRAELDGEFHEVVQEEVSVSGTVVVGVAAAGALSGPATLAGLLIPTSAPHVCLTLLSRDGVYYSRNTYRIPEPANAVGAAFALLPFERTSRRDLIAGYAEGELAVRATAGSCEDSASVYLVASAEGAFDTVDVLINSFGANAVYYRTADGVEFDCSEFTEGRRTSFDYRCEVGAGLLGAGRQTLVIERERYGRPLGAVEIQLQLTAAP